MTRNEYIAQLSVAGNKQGFWDNHLERAIKKADEIEAAGCAPWQDAPPVTKKNQPKQPAQEKKAEDSLNSTQIGVLQLVEKMPFATNKKMGHKIGRHLSAVHHALQHLVFLGLVKIEGRTNQRRMVITQKGKDILSTATPPTA